MPEKKDSFRKLFIITGIIAVIVIAFAFWWQRQNALPVIKIPTHVMPNPNAFDYYMRAAGAMVDKNKIDFAIDDTPRSSSQSKIPPPQSGGLPPLPPGAINTQQYDRVYTLAEKESIVKNNARALKMLRDGFAYPYMSPLDRSLTTRYPYFPEFRRLSRLLTLEGQTKTSHGDWAGAMNSNLDSLRLGEDVPRGGTLIARLCGIPIQAIGRREAWKIIDHLSAAEAKSAVRQIETIMSRHVPIAETYEEEKWCMLASLQEFFQKGANYNDFFGTPQTKIPHELWMRFRFAAYSKGRILKNNSAYMDQLAARTRLPYADKTPQPKIPDDPVNQMLLPVFSRTTFTFVKNDAQNSLLLITLALSAYRLEHSEYPTSLALLVPSYLKKLPDDPFAAKGTLHYKRTGDKYILYSIGPDGKDDGGKLIVDPSIKGSPKPGTQEYWRKYYVEENSKGDIVAGINK